MKKFITLSIFVFIAFISFSSFENGITSFFIDRTGSPPSGGMTSCGGGSCHLNSSSSSGLTLGITLTDNKNNIVTNGQYIPGQNYTLTFKGHLSGGGPFPVYGLQFTTANSNDGQFVQIDNKLKSTMIGVHEYFDHKAPIQVVGNDYSCKLVWVAPPPGAGPISFYATMLVGNEDHTINGDWDANSAITFNEGIPTSVNDLSEIANIRLAPNPVFNELSLDFDVEKNGLYSVSVYDLSGKEIYSKEISIHTTRYTEMINASSWASGLYSVCISHEHKLQTFKIVKR